MNESSGFHGLQRQFWWYRVATVNTSRRSRWSCPLFGSKCVIVSLCILPQCHQTTCWSDSPRRFWILPDIWSWLSRWTLDLTGTQTNYDGQEAIPTVLVIICPRGSIPFPQSRRSAHSPSPHFDSCARSLRRLDYCLPNRSGWDPIGQGTTADQCCSSGRPQCLAHQCRCGATVQSDGLHPLSCRISAGRFPRHSTINNIEKRSRDAAGLHSILQPVGLDRGDGRRPDGVTSFPFKGGKALAWDATCTDSFSASNLCSTILNPDSVSSAAEDLKKKKYSQLVTDSEFEPVAVETSGIIGSAGCF